MLKGPTFLKFLQIQHEKESIPIRRIFFLGDSHNYEEDDNNRGNERQFSSSSPIDFRKLPEYEYQDWVYELLKLGHKPTIYLESDETMKNRILEDFPTVPDIKLGDWWSQLDVFRKKIFPTGYDRIELIDVRDQNDQLLEIYHGIREDNSDFVDKFTKNIFDWSKIGKYILTGEEGEKEYNEFILTFLDDVNPRKTIKYTDDEYISLLKFFNRFMDKKLKEIQDDYEKDPFYVQWMSFVKIMSVEMDFNFLSKYIIEESPITDYDLVVSGNIHCETYFEFLNEYYHYSEYNTYRKDFPKLSVAKFYVENIAQLFDGKIEIVNH